MRAQAPRAGLVELVHEELEVQRRVQVGQIPEPTFTCLAQIRADHCAFPGLAEVARRAGCSPSHLRAHFREHRGMAPRTYLVRHRALRALVVIARDPTRPLRESCHDVGYTWAEDLSRPFRRVMGMSPFFVRRVLQRHGPVASDEDLSEAVFHVEQCARRAGLVSLPPDAERQRLKEEMVDAVRGEDRLSLLDGLDGAS